MGGSSSSIGDLFYPDNPSRRDRASQLRRDVENLVNQFKELKPEVEKRSTELRAKMDNYLQTHGYKDFGQLDAAVQDKLEGDALDKWNSMREHIETGNLVVEVVMTISGVGFAGGGVAIGGLVLTQMMTGAAGWSMLGNLGIVTGVLAVAAIIIGIIDGANQRSELQTTIRDLCKARLQIRFALDNMSVYRSWIANFDKFFVMEVDGDMTAAAVTKIFDKQFSKDLSEDFASVTLENSCEKLNQDDKNRKAWTNEDPGNDSTIQAVRSENSPKIKVRMRAAIKPKAPPPPDEIPVKTLSLKPEGDDSSLAIEFALESVISQTTCIVTDKATSDRWTMEAVPCNHEHEKGSSLGLDDVHFNLVNLTDLNKTMRMCMVTVV